MRLCWPRRTPPVAVGDLTPHDEETAALVLSAYTARAVQAPDLLAARAHSVATFLTGVLPLAAAAVVATARGGSSYDVEGLTWAAAGAWTVVLLLFRRAAGSLAPATSVEVDPDIVAKFGASRGLAEAMLRDIDAERTRARSKYRLAVGAMYVAVLMTAAAAAGAVAGEEWKQAHVALDRRAHDAVAAVCGRPVSADGFEVDVRTLNKPMLLLRVTSGCEHRTVQIRREDVAVVSVR